jgi:hypothetical protein
MRRDRKACVESKHVCVRWASVRWSKDKDFQIRPSGARIPLRGMTRAQIRAPFDGEIISPKTWLSDTIDNVKSKINNVKAKTQDEEDPGPQSRPSLARRPVLDQLGASMTSSLPEGPPPTSLRLARQVSASHDKSPPLTTSLSLAQRILRPVRVPPNSDWGVGHDTRHDPGIQTPPPRRMGNQFPTPCNHTSWQTTQAADPDRGLNAGLLNCAAIPSPSYPTQPPQALPEALKHHLR